MKEKEWKIPYARPEIPEALTQAGYGPLLAAVLALRGVTTAQAAAALLEGGPELLHDPLGMRGMDVASRRVRQAIERGETVAVYGDYDVDGITATCLVTDYLRGRGLRVFPYIPDRNEEGYGLNRAALESLHNEGVSLLITVDCGITAAEESEFGRELGMDVVITDHHECKSGEIPDAVAVVDCKQPGDGYPNPSLAGVGVAFKLVCAVDGDAEAMLARYADLVAVGTVADVMPLVDENRFLVQRGLEKLERDPLPGFAAMLKEAGVDPQRLSAATVGFSLAPRLNAAGRLGQAGRAAELLMCREPEKAAALAAKLCELNRKRQNIETEIWQEAQAMLEGKTPEGPIVLASEHWHQGVIGIAASRLAEQFSLPAIMICLNGDQGKGSCRSYGGFNLFEALAACSEHLVGFGGHALAAGLNIRRDKLGDFRRALEDYFRLNRPAPQPEVCCDLLLRDAELLSIANVRELDRLEPFGNQNPKPVFCFSGARLEAADAVGNGRHLRVRLGVGSGHLEGIFFGHSAQELGIRPGEDVDVAFTPQINDFRGHVSVQLLLCAARPHDPLPLCREILAGERAACWAAADYCPERGDFVRVWRRDAGALRVPESEEAILAACPAGMAPETYCLCLMTLLECGLLQSEDGRIFGAHSAVLEGKADLEATDLMAALRGCRKPEERSFS